MKKFSIKFYQHRKIYIGISLAIFAVGIICNLIFGTELDIDFRGGALVEYSYTGTIDQETVDQAIADALGQPVTVTITDGLTDAAGNSTNTLTISLSGSDGISLDDQQAIDDQLAAAYPDSTFEMIQSSSVPPTMGSMFFAKCLVAVGLAAVLLVVYVAFRFRKIGGMSAGVMSLVALFHDVLMVYFTFVIFGFHLDYNFIAVVLTILGYSLNNTIVVYDRVRENRRLLGPKAGYEELVDTSINQTLTRSINTSLCTFLAIAVVFIVGLVFNLSSVTTFALPMMIGIVTGCYSSVCLAGPLYVMWQNHKQKKRAVAETK